MTYFDKQPTSQLKYTQLKGILRNIPFTINSASGLFSIQHIDNATRLLIDHAHIQGEVLDLGCGYGIIGIMIKKAFPELNVTLSDVNPRAIKVSKENAKQMKVDVQVVESDIFSNLGKFDTILTNPPYVAGREVCFSFIEGAFEHLNPNGSFQLVARHQKGGKMLEKKMEEVFGNVETIAKGSGFRVYKSVKSSE